MVMDAGGAQVDERDERIGAVDRHRPDRVLAVAELGEERLQGGGVATGRAPHDRGPLVIDDAGQVAVPAPVPDLADADGDQAGQAALVEVVSDNPRDDAPDGVPADVQQAGDRRLGHLLSQPGDDIFEVAGVMSARASPRHRLGPHAAVRAAQQPQLARSPTAWRPDRGDVSA